MRVPAFPILFLLLASASCRQAVQSVNRNSSESHTSIAPASQPASRERCLNLNAATITELERLPGIGEVTARKIIAYREQNGPFRRPEDLIIIEGFSERKYRSIAELVCVN
jgi:competence protein ComEA